MAHEVESMAYFGTVPWHGLGTEIGEDLRYDYLGVLKAAQLDWAVELVPVYAKVREGFVELHDSHAVQRDSDGAILGVVGRRYVPLQNEAALAWFEPFLETKVAAIETAGSLRGGRIVWALAKVGMEAEVRKGDPVEGYLLLTHGHDGRHVIQVGFTPIRVVCNNTLRAAKFDAKSKLLRIKHTENHAKALELVRDVMLVVKQDFEASIEQYRKLAQLKVNEEDLKKYVRVVFKAGVDENMELTPEEELPTKTVNRLNQVMELVEAGAGNGKGSWWDAYNGVTEFLSYHSGRSQDTRLESLWLGQGAALNQRALEVAVEMSGVAA